MRVSISKQQGKYDVGNKKSNLILKIAMTFNAYIIKYKIAFNEQYFCKLLLTRPTFLSYLPIMFDANCISIVCVNTKGIIYKKFMYN